jgi:hypothetical protein
MKHPFKITAQQLKDTLPPPPWHYGTRYAGTTVEWLPTDTEEWFNHLMQNPDHQAYFRERGWDQPGAITYKINSHGFRSGEFSMDADSVVTLGCSYSVGIGLPNDGIWPTMVGKALNLDTYNLAWGGASADTCFMLAQYWVPVLRPKLVILAAPPQSRIDILLSADDPGTNIFETIMPNTTAGKFSDDVFLKHWFTNERNASLNNSRNKLAIQALCNNLNIPCLTYNAHDFFARSREEVGYARDYMHAGLEGHSMFTKKILSDCNEISFT